MVTCWQWEDLTTPSPPLETRCTTAMGRNSVPSKRKSIHRIKLVSTPLPRDRDQGTYISNCANYYGGGGWWFKACARCYLTGQHTDTKFQLSSNKHIWYRYGGERPGGSSTLDSWKEVQMMLFPRSVWWLFLHAKISRKLCIWTIKWNV